jgi:hypothetical protein
MAMQGKCPACQRELLPLYRAAHERVYSKDADLYKAVIRKDNQLVKVILTCDKHRKEQMHYIDLSLDDGTPLIKAAIVGNYEAVNLLVTAGVNILFTNRSGHNIFNYGRYKDRKKTMATIIDSLQLFEQIQSFCSGEFGQRLYQKEINQKILGRFFAVAGCRFYLSTWFTVLLNEKLIDKDNQKKVQEFGELKKNKMDILVKHSPTLSKLPLDLRNIIKSLLFPHSS